MISTFAYTESIMKIRKNTYFETMMKIAKAYENVRSEHEKKKDQIVETYGYGSKELDTWYDEKTVIERQLPYTSGEYIALRSWWLSKEESFECVVISEFFLNKEDVKDFVNTMRKAGITEFLTVDSSTALMGNISWFTDCGCTISALCEVHSGRWDEVKPGLKFRIEDKDLNSV